MPEASRTVFISYRRAVSWSVARLVCKDLIDHGFHALMDVENVHNGEFERVILTQIADCAHFIVVLQPGSLDGIAADGDWLRREIAQAIARKRNIVPLTYDGFSLRQDLALPADIASLTSFNAVVVTHEYFDPAMQRLRERFLRPSETPPVTPTPSGTEEDLAQDAPLSITQPGKNTTMLPARLGLPFDVVRGGYEITQVNRGISEILDRIADPSRWIDVRRPYFRVVSKPFKAYDRTQVDSFVRKRRSPPSCFNDGLAMILDDYGVLLAPKHASTQVIGEVRARCGVPASEKLVSLMEWQLTNGGRMAFTNWGIRVRVDDNFIGFPYTEIKQINMSFSSRCQTWSGYNYGGSITIPTLAIVSKGQQIEIDDAQETVREMLSAIQQLRNSYPE